MRTSTTIVEKIERLLMAPGWTYCTMWWFPPILPTSRPRALPSDRDQRGAHR